MAQLIMRWTNDHKKPQELQIPENCQIVRFTELDNALDKWLDIMQYGLSDGKQDDAYYRDCMIDSYPNYEEDKCFFVIEGEKAVASLTVICDREKKEGYIHMVACHESARGKGYGTLLNNVALITLKEEGMETAYLTTDDWRIPAIKSYLRADFMPDLSTDDFKERWSKIYGIIGR